jgi:hypothetical protein
MLYVVNRLLIHLDESGWGKIYDWIIENDGSPYNANIV